VVATLIARLFLNMGWDWSVGPWFIPRIYAGWIVSTGLTIASGFALANWRRSALTTPEIALYWLGSGLALAGSMAGLFEALNWTWLNGGYLSRMFSGLFTGCLLAAFIGVVVLVHWRRRSAEPI
jgi:hypothetical protein